MKIVRIAMPNSEPYEIGFHYNRHKLHGIKLIQKNGQMAYIDWYQLLDKDGNVFAEVNSMYVESIYYESEDE